MNAIQAKATKAAPTSSFLAGLRFSDEQRPTKNLVHRSPRDVVREYIETQISMAKADLAGEPFTVKRTRFQKDNEGISRKREVDAVPRRGYWRTSDEYHFSIKYGNVVVRVAEKQSVVAGAGLEDVVRTLDIIRLAVDAGELDGAIDASAVAAKNKREKLGPTK